MKQKRKGRRSENNYLSSGNVWMGLSGSGIERWYSWLPAPVHTHTKSTSAVTHLQNCFDTKYRQFFGNYMRRSRSWYSFEAFFCVCFVWVHLPESLCHINGSIDSTGAGAGGGRRRGSLQLSFLRFSTKEFITGFCSYNTDCVNWMSFCSSTFKAFRRFAFLHSQRRLWTEFHFAYLFFFWWVFKRVRAQRSSSERNPLPNFGIPMWCEAGKQSKFRRKTFKDTISIPLAIDIMRHRDIGGGRKKNQKFMDR